MQRSALAVWIGRGFGAATCALPLLGAVVVTRVIRVLRPRVVPRVVLGPTQVINIKYWSEALKMSGIPSTTVVDGIYHINNRSDFDVVRTDFLPSGLLFEPFRDYLMFIWVILHSEVIVTFFDGGFLKNTPFRSVEWLLLRLSGTRTIVTAYGSDIAVPGYLGPFEEVMATSYADLMRQERRITERVDYISSHADLIIKNLQPGYLPRWDVFWPVMLAIDTDDWTPAARAERARSLTDDPNQVTIVHASNHRSLKGTDSVIKAVEELKEEGQNVELFLLERRPNEEVRTYLAQCDIVADQFVAGFASFAVEGLASGKPVVSNIDWLDDEVRTHGDLQDCPIVDATTETLVDRLRQLIVDPALRRQLGAEGRDFALSRYSYGVVGPRMASLVLHVWNWGRGPRNAYGELLPLKARKGSETTTT